MTARTPRQLAREATLARIRALAMEQLAEGGADTLSLRAIARQLDIVSSAIYRYYASRDDLITALIVESYDDLADTLDAVGLHRRNPRLCWLDRAHALRSWARAAPHRFALIYGSAIPGYRAPTDTVAPAGRVLSAFATPLVGAAATTREPIGRALTGQFVAVAATIEVDLDPPTAHWLVRSFAGMIGLLTLELNGHLVGGFEPADALWEHQVADDLAALDWPA